MVGIYKITSPTGKIYIGQSSDVERRISAYKRMSNCNQQPKLYNSLKKYGARNHLYEAIEECDINNCTERERYYQELYNSVKEGLNCVYVDNSNSKTSICDETRQKMSKARKGVKFTDHHKERISKALKGKVRSIEHRLNLSKSNKGRMTGEHHHNSILLINTETGIYYDTVKEASETLSISPTTLNLKIHNNIYNNTSFVLADKFDSVNRHVFNYGNPRSKIVFNTETGIYYNDIKEASDTCKYSSSTLRNKIKGYDRYKNNTAFIYA